MRRTLFGLATASCLGLAAAASGAARADCLADLKAASAAQLKSLDEQDSVPSRTATITTDLRTGKVLGSVLMERAPPDRSRAVVRHGGTVDETVATATRLWVGHGGPLQEVPDQEAHDRIAAAHQRVATFRTHIAAIDWAQEAQDLACRDTTLDGRPVELFTYTDAANKAKVRLYATRDTHEALRTEFRTAGREIVQTVAHGDVTIAVPDSPATPAPAAAAPGTTPAHPMPTPQTLSPVRP
ncbi:hypothetical protein [Acidisphaera rubrifaciens]|uniref:Lipoprotein n=1 Tax=Acidisphaera rubrifaciens HS-AP3 TaxID=1231350 RepID=A0A0D6P9H6_9PROT|nr:hypothetical protein [Acidisphaera rubrifaciens]GAN78415.1 hypothetical protein Asru_0827_04 [Acidisphaera rubrifaciens HS-AP3]